MRPPDRYLTAAFIGASSDGAYVRSMRSVIVVPTYDEAATIGALLDDIGAGFRVMRIHRAACTT